MSISSQLLEQVNKRHGTPWRAVERVAICARLVLGIILLFSGLQHVLRPREFLAAVEAYQLAPYAINKFAASVLPWSELGLGISLITGAALAGGLALSCVIFALYCAAIASALLRTLNIDCGCYLPGIGSSSVSGWVLMRTLAFFLIACGLYCRDLLRASDGVRVIKNST